MPRGQGRVFRPEYTDKRTGKSKQQKIFWADYSIDGQRVRESTHATTKREALRFLHQRLAERGRGIRRRDVERTTLNDLAELIRADYTKNGRRSVDRMERSVRRLQTFFDGWKAIHITTDAADRYASMRLKNGAAAATVNRELACLRRMLNLAVRAGMLIDPPRIELLEENNVRTGFVEPNEMARIVEELPEHLKPLAITGYVTGWRVGELLSRSWKHVDLKDGWMRLDPGETKNREGRQFPLGVVPWLAETLDSQAKVKQLLERRTGSIVEPLFFYYGNGRPIKSFYGSWRSAVDRAGLPGLIFHDFRRSAARNLIRAGISETVAMKLTGHKTRSVFDRYAIVDEKMLEEQAAKLAGLRPTSTDRKVVPLSA